MMSHALQLTTNSAVAPVLFHRLAGGKLWLSVSGAKIVKHHHGREDENELRTHMVRELHDQGNMSQYG
jgi:hypothetical protein